MTDLNESGRAFARALISAGKIDRTSSWDFTQADGDALLGAGGNDDIQLDHDGPDERH